MVVWVICALAIATSYLIFCGKKEKTNNLRLTLSPKTSSAREVPQKTSMPGSNGPATATPTQKEEKLPKEVKEEAMPKGKSPKKAGTPRKTNKKEEKKSSLRQDEKARGECPIKTDKTLKFDLPMESEKEVQGTEIPSIDEENPLASKHIQDRLRVWKPDSTQTTKNTTTTVEMPIMDNVERAQNVERTQAESPVKALATKTQDTEEYFANDMNMPTTELKVEMSMRPQTTNPVTKSTYY